MTPGCLLGIDVGTSTVKTIAVTPAGELVGSATAGYRSTSRQPGWVEQDPVDWWRAVCGTVREVAAQVTRRASRIEAVGLSGHMSSLVALDGHGRPVRPCITIIDRRGAAEAAWMTREFGPRILAVAGGRASTSDLAPKLLWLKRCEPATYRAAAAFVCAKDYIRFLLCGEVATEATDAGNTLFFDVRRRVWDLELCKDLGLDPAKLPGLVPTTAVVGRITGDAAAATGLSTGTPVAAGGADMACSAVGTASLSAGDVAVTIGSSAQVITPVGDLLAAEGRVSFHPHAAEGLLYAMGSVFSGGTALRWLASAFGEEDLRARLGDLYYERLSMDAARAPAGSGGVVFLPFLVGSGTPDFDPLLRGAFVGLSLGVAKRHLVRSVLEGVAYNVRECVETFRDLGLVVSVVRMAGGGAASEVWRSIVADVLDMPLSPTRITQASALGAAILAAVASGVYGSVDQAARAMVATCEPVEPDPGRAGLYDERFREYLAWRAASVRIAHGSTAQRPDVEGLT